MLSSKAKDDKYLLFNKGVRLLQLPHIYQWVKARFSEAANAWQLCVLLSDLKVVKIDWLNKFWMLDILRAEKIVSGVWINMFTMITKHFRNIFCPVFLSTACRMFHGTVRKPQWKQLRTYLLLPSHPTLMLPYQRGNLVDVTWSIIFKSLVAVSCLFFYQSACRFFSDSF